MAKNKIYAVRKGKATGLFYNWDACKSAVEGYSGAEYRGFSNEFEAQKYLDGEYADISNKDIETKELPTDVIAAYVDGSFDEKHNKYAFGCVIITPNGEIVRESGSNDDPECVSLRNVAGEIAGAMYAVRWCIKNRYPAIRIIYDYSGIEMWSTGAWRAKTNLTKEYADFMHESMEQVNISFEKVKAHSGDRFNEEADALARDALLESKGMPKVKQGAFWFTVDKVTFEEVNTIVELIKEEIGSSDLVIEFQSAAYYEEIKLKLKRDKITVHHYSKGNKVVVQGKPQKLFSTFVSYIMELVEVEDIPKIFNNTYRLEIDKNEVQMELQYYMPNAYDKLPVKLSKSLHQAVYNLKIDGDMFDGTFLAQPVIRAIEAHLKIVLNDKEIISDWSHIKEYGFDMFEKIGAKFKLKAECMGKATSDEAKYIGNCYTFYNMNRNKLSHWDDPTAPLDTTVLLRVNDAHDLIKRTLTLIDSYYE